MLDYDNSAFYYFMITMLAIYLMPAWLYTIKYVIRAFAPVTDPASIPRTKAEKAKLAKLKENERGMQMLSSRCFVVNLGFTIACSLLLLFLIWQVWADSELARFDPYKILDIDRGATDKQIKRAYKIKALEFHPDKNIGDSKAEQMFMMVAKAYEALTDEAARENWELYGNPDGKQSLEVSIGLPTFLLEKDNHNVILVVYLVLLVVVTPTIVGLWYQHSRKFGENNVMYATYGFFARFGLTAATSVKALPEVLAAAQEFAEINSVQDRAAYEEVSNLLKLFRSKQLDGFMAKPRFDKVPKGLCITKGNIILHAHLGRHVLEPLGADVPQAWSKNRDKMLAQSSPLITAMLDICANQRWLQTALNVMEFSQFVTQGLWLKAPPHLQLPHLTMKEVKHMISGKGGAKDFKDYLSLPDDQKKGLNNLDDDARMEVYRVCKLIPDIDIKLKWFVEDEQEIAERDTVTVQVKLTRNNVPDGGKAQPVYAPGFPGKKEEGWWVMLTEVRHEHLISIEKITDQSKEVTHECKFQAPPREGLYKFMCHIVSDSYLGLDQTIPFEMKVIAAAELPEFEAHKDDLELDNEMSLFEQVLLANQDSDQSSDEEEEPPPEDKAAVTAVAAADQTEPANNSGLTSAQLRRRQKRQAAKKGKATPDGEEGEEEEEEGS